jgi:hypothetical protein
MPAMEDLHRLEAKGLARAKIRSRRRRVSIVRRRTFRGSLALFAVLWAIIFGQLVTGNDPALSRIRGHGQAATTHGTGMTAAPSPGATASTAPPPEPEAESESGLESEREPGGAEREFEAEHASEPQPEPEPVAPIVTTAS